MHLLQIRGANGFVAHTVTVCNGMIFYSNLKFAVPLNRFNIEYCVNAAYIGIFWGYHIAPRVAPRIFFYKNAKAVTNETSKKEIIVIAKFYKIDICMKRIKFSCLCSILPSLHQLICLAMLILSLKVTNTYLSGH
jgi:hypothetical protein